MINNLAKNRALIISCQIFIISNITNLRKIKFFHFLKKKIILFCNKKKAKADNTKIIMTCNKITDNIEEQKTIR